jgi:hypothetical protein
VQYENDWPWGDGRDRFRTAALQLKYQDFSAGFNLYTGDPGPDEYESVDYEGGTYEYSTGGLGHSPDKYRAGVAYFGYREYKFGVNSEQVRDVIQNKIIHRSMNNHKKAREAQNQGGNPKDYIRTPYFKVLSSDKANYGSIGKANPFSLW